MLVVSNGDGVTFRRSKKNDGFKNRFNTRLDFLNVTCCNAYFWGVKMSLQDDYDDDNTNFRKL